MQHGITVTRCKHLYQTGSHLSAPAIERMLVIKEKPHDQMSNSGRTSITHTGQQMQVCLQVCNCKFESHQAGLPVSIMHKAKRAVLHMLLPMCKLPELAATVEVPHLELPTVAACQQAPLLGIQCHGRQAPIAVAALEVALALPCVDVPHADCAALIATEDLQQGRAQAHQITLLKLSLTMVMRSPVWMFHMQIVPLSSPLRTCSTVQYLASH